MIKKEPTPEPLAVSVKEAAALLGVSVVTIHRKIRRAKIKTFKLGRRRLIEREVINRIINGDV